MPARDNKTLWESWQELRNGDLTVADEIVAPDFVARFAPAGTAAVRCAGPRA